jgi:hypothetical protein
LIATATIVPDDTTIVGDLTVQSTDGIDINPGSDVDTDLISIGVTGSPKIKWNETQDALQFIEKLILGTNAILTKTVNGSSYTSKMSLDTDTTTDSGGIDITRHGSSDASYGSISLLRSRGTHASPTIVQSGDLISSIVGLGYDGVDYEPVSSIEMYSDETPGSNDMPGRIDFKTVSDGSRVLNQVMRIGRRSDVMIGTTTSDSSSILEVQSVTKGSRPFPRMAQTQRDAIVSPATGLSIFNNDFNTFDFYNGSSWLSLLGTTTTQEFSGKTVSGSLKFKESGGGSNYTAFQAPASLTGDVTFTLPDGDGTSGQVMKTNGSGTLSWSNDLSSSVSSSSEVSNLSIVTSVGSSALTIAVKTQSGSDASGGDPINVGIRGSTGGYNQRTITAALSLVVSSGSTLGQASASTARLFIYLIDNAGTLELAVSQTLYPDNKTISTTAEGGAGAADSGTVIYSTTARSSVNFRLIGTLQNTQTTAGTWASAGSNLRLVNSTADAVESVNARYTTNAAQSITNASNTNIIDFEDISFDSHSAVTTGASWKFQAPVSGIYEAKAVISTTSTGNFSGTEYIELKLYKNGSFYSSKYLSNFTGSSVQITTAQTDQVALLAGETINFIVYQTSGGSMPLDSAAGYNWVNIERIGN